MRLNEQIKNHRKEVGLTQEQVANYLNVSTPAVNKWEKGSTYPDISLLPALARLLKIDMNELFSFHGELTELEIGLFAKEVSETALNGTLDLAFEMATKKIQTYPRCDSLIYAVAVILNSALTLSIIEDRRKAEYEKKIIDWLEQAVNSQDEKVKTGAVYTLATKYIQEQNYDKAGALLDQVPDANIDKTLLQVNILMHQEDEDGAAVLLEGKIMQALTRTQSYLYKLIEIEERTGNHCEAEQIAGIADKMIPLFGLWHYGTVTPHLLIAVYRKDAAQCINLIKEALEAAQKPWNMGESPLYYRYPAKKTFERLGNRITHALISEIESQKEYEFLKDNEALKRILAEYQQESEA